MHRFTGRVVCCIDRAFFLTGACRGGEGGGLDGAPDEGPVSETTVTC